MERRFNANAYAVERAPPVGQNAPLTLNPPPWEDRRTCPWLEERGDGHERRKWGSGRPNSSMQLTALRAAAGVLYWGPPWILERRRRFVENPSIDRNHARLPRPKRNTLHPQRSPGIQRAQQHERRHWLRWV